MLSDKKFRKKVVDKIQDPVVKSFWVNEFSSYADKFASEAVSPIQNKVGQFLSSALIRNIVGQVKSSIDMRKVMDEGKILIMNLSKGRIGEDNSALLGAMMITKIQLAAMSRVDVPEKERKDFYLYVDEFQNFATDSFANILSEARKYRLDLILAHQYIEQLNEKVKYAVFGNVGTMVVFRIGAADAEELQPEFSPVFTEEDMVNLPKFEFYTKLMIDGIASEPFSARGLSPLTEEEKSGNLDKVVKVSRERYAKERRAVEEKISRWHSNTDEDDYNNDSHDDLVKDRKKQNNKLNDKKNQQSKANNGHSAKDLETKEKKSKKSVTTKCFRCGKETTVSFIPDGIRPVYCEDCLQQNRKDKQSEIEDRKRRKEEELRQLEELNSLPGKTVTAIFQKETSVEKAPADAEAEIKENEEIRF